ncbi:MAG: flagellar biosynthesis repressor FlbT [Alphaproteobacteria bacterium]|nr:flagellar biosynthesis repressor FlbT [Alphaproteobacteria bacterium]
MTGLVLKLKPNEKVLVNGVLLQNGDRAARIRVRSSNVSILRSRDAISPQDANTPLTRIYYIAQLALAGQAKPDEAMRQVRDGIDQLSKIFTGHSAQELARARSAAGEEKFFLVMRALKRLFPIEKAMLARREGAP